MLPRRNRNGNVTDNGNGNGNGDGIDQVPVTGRYPVSEITKLDEIVAREFGQMTLDDREKVFEQIHGVERIPPEEPGFVSLKLEEMEMELCKIKDKPLYDEALKISKGYVQDRNLRMMFLRADSFHARKAAKRLIRFLEGKVKYFGKATLARPLYWSDLDKDGQRVARSGYMQILASRDIAGRAIFCDCHEMFPKLNVPLRSMMKNFIFLLLQAASDEETQRLGFVFIFYQMQQVAGDRSESRTRDLSSEDVAEFVEAATLISFLPVRIAAAHFCADNPVVITLVKLLLLSGSQDFRARHRLHYGSSLECEYSLRTFGIPVDNLPITSDGEIKKANHARWISKWKSTERQLKPNKTAQTADVRCASGGGGTGPASEKKEFSVLASTRTSRSPIVSEAGAGDVHGVSLPGRSDILVGKGKPIQQHAGNILMRSLVAKHLEEYQRLAKGTKIIACQKVLALVRESSGRFLRKDEEGWWVEIPDQIALEKIGKAFKTAQASAQRRPTKQVSAEVAQNGGAAGGNAFDVSENGRFFLNNDRQQQLHLPATDNTRKGCCNFFGV